MLHPTLESKQLPTETEAVVGTKAKLTRMFGSKKRIKIEPKYYTRYKEFSKLPAANLDIPVIRNASPYISEEELYRMEYIKSKQRWVDGQPFKTYFGKASSSSSSNFIPNYVTLTPSEPPALHKFRNLEKDKWVDDNFKF